MVKLLSALGMPLYPIDQPPRIGHIITTSFDETQTFYNIKKTTLINNCMK